MSVSEQLSFDGFKFPLEPEAKPGRHLDSPEMAEHRQKLRDEVLAIGYYPVAASVEVEQNTEAEIPESGEAD